MTDLFERLFPEDPETNNIAEHYFFAALVDYAVGETTRQQIINWWELDAEAQVDLNTLCNTIDALPDKVAKLAFGEEIHAVIMFTKAGAKYTTKAEFRERLGL